MKNQFLLGKNQVVSQNVAKTTLDRCKNNIAMLFGCDELPDTLADMFLELEFAVNEYIAMTPTLCDACRCAPVCEHDMDATNKCEWYISIAE